MAYFASNFDSEDIQIIQGEIPEPDEKSQEAFDRMFQESANAFEKMFIELWRKTV